MLLLVRLRERAILACWLSLVPYRTEAHYMEYMEKKLPE
jgi:hypothetical protein